MELTPREEQVREALIDLELADQAARFAHVSHRHAVAKCKIAGHRWQTQTAHSGHAYAECLRCGEISDI